MKLTIPCEVYSRLSVVAAQAIAELNCLRIEVVKNSVVAMVTDSRILAAEFIELTNIPNGALHIAIDPVLIAQCEMESAFDSKITFEKVSGIDWITATTTFGYSYPGNAGKFDVDKKLGLWRSIVPEPAKKAAGFIYQDGDLLSRLARSAPSRRLTYPRIVDTSQPLIVRDAIDPAWLGMFRATDKDQAASLTAATVPEWLGLA